MKNLWNENAAAQCKDDLDQRVYTSRLLGQDRSLVLHGGGNTSVKLNQRNIFGEEEPVLLVKGSGWDLETIERDGFSPCRMEHLLRLARLDQLSDMQMAAELQASMTVPTAPAPSVEAILHALIPGKFVDHTHADVVIAVMNTAAGEERVREIYGGSVLIVPYSMPGFKLARACANLLSNPASTNAIGMILMHHGVFSWGDTAKDAYDRMIELVSSAEQYLALRRAWSISLPLLNEPPRSNLRVEIASLRRAVSTAAGTPMLLQTHTDDFCVSFARRPDIAVITQRGTATPDHVIRTKRTPMIGRDAAAYSREYELYFERNRGGQNLTKLDGAPRVILDKDLGLCLAGRTAKDARIAADVYRQTMDIILRAEALGGWRALPEADLFEMEYWDLEQAKLKR